MVVNKGTQVQQTAAHTVFSSLQTVVYILYMLLHLWGCGNFLWWRISFLIVRRHVTFDPEDSVRHNQAWPSLQIEIPVYLFAIVSILLSKSRRWELSQWNKRNYHKQVMSFCISDVGALIRITIGYVAISSEALPFTFHYKRSGFFAGIWFTDFKSVRDNEFYFY